MNPIPLTDPPTNLSLSSARNSLQSHQSLLAALSNNITHAESALAQIIAESRCTISLLSKEKDSLEAQVRHLEAYLAPVRRLPEELLREVFSWAFEAHPCAAWVLSAVCQNWRRLAIGMPRIWSKIRLVTNPQSSPDTIRLWLERSGTHVPLDIEIFLQVKPSSPTISSSPLPLSPAPFIPSSPPGFIPTYMPAVPPPPPIPVSAGTLPPAHTPIIITPSPNQIHHISGGWASPPLGVNGRERERRESKEGGSHWGHITIWYLVQQMKRWERFVFRFEKQFGSMGALKSIVGEAPILKEFEVSCAEPAFFADWPWLPCSQPPPISDSASSTSSSAPPTPTPSPTPSLHTLTLLNAPFKYSSPMLLSSSLTSLTLRALPTTHLPLDRILSIIEHNRTLEECRLFFGGVMSPILPLSPIRLEQCRTLSIGGHYLLSGLVDSITTPVLDDLTLDIEARDPIEDCITSLIARSNKPPVGTLSVAYTTTASNSSPFYYGPGGVLMSWTVLSELPHLHTLKVGGTPLEPLLTALGRPDEDANGGRWMCTGLTRLLLKNCPAHGDLGKLISFVDARNPEGSGSGGGSVAKLKELEMWECAVLGADVVKWLRGRIGAVKIKELSLDGRSPLGSHPYLN